MQICVSFHEAHLRHNFLEHFLPDGFLFLSKRFLSLYSLEKAPFTFMINNNNKENNNKERALR